MKRRHFGKLETGWKLAGKWLAIHRGRRRVPERVVRIVRWCYRPLRSCPRGRSNGRIVAMSVRASSLDRSHAGAIPSFALASTARPPSHPMTCRRFGALRLRRPSDAGWVRGPGPMPALSGQAAMVSVPPSNSRRHARQPGNLPAAAYDRHAGRAHHQLGLAAVVQRGAGCLFFTWPVVRDCSAIPKRTTVQWCKACLPMPSHGFG